MVLAQQADGVLRLVHGVSSRVGGASSDAVPAPMAVKRSADDARRRRRAVARPDRAHAGRVDFADGGTAFVKAEARADDEAVATLRWACAEFGLPAPEPAFGPLGPWRP
jgi:hypothetical protein